MSTERWSFEGSKGGTLAARVERPEGPTRGWALFAHCFTCSKDLKSAVWLTRALSARGIGVVRFDFTGIGESEGDFAHTDFTSNVEDLLAAARAMQRSGWPARLLLGHSIGGAAVLAAASQLPEVAAVATLAAPSDHTALTTRIRAGAPQLAAGADSAEVLLAGRPVRIGRGLLEELETHRLEEHVARLGRPLLLLHSPSDDVVAFSHAERLYGWARHPKSLVALPGASHLMLGQQHQAAYAAEVLAAWAAPYLEAPPLKPEAPLPTAAGVRVVGGAKGYRTEVHSGRHRLVADEPRSVGGSDEGPNPYDYLLAALGACTSMTLRMYADRKGVALEGVEVRLRHQKVHATDCAECTTREGRVDFIEREVVLHGPLSPEERSRLLEIADRCPVHRTLHSEVHVSTREASE